MSVQAVKSLNADPYIRDGIVLINGSELKVDASRPNAIPIAAINELTGEIKHYMLRVTSKGTLCIV